MKIDGTLYSQAPLPSSQPRRAKDARAAEQQPQQPTKEDAVSVQLSSQATQMSSDAIRQNRLASIREQLSAGTYNISGKDVANKILNALKG